MIGNVMIDVRLIGKYYYCKYKVMNLNYLGNFFFDVYWVVMLFVFGKKDRIWM